MTLAARHRAWPVIFGSLTAFAILNILAVSFGAALAHWIPVYILAAIVCLLFTNIYYFSGGCSPSILSGFYKIASLAELISNLEQ